MGYQKIFLQLISGGGIRDLARELKQRDSTIQNRIERFAHWCQGFHDQARRWISYQGDLVTDGFESFSYSQYHPNNINILVAKESQFLLSSGLCVLNRKGRMTDEQRE